MIYPRCISGWRLGSAIRPRCPPARAREPRVLIGGAGLKKGLERRQRCYETRCISDAHTRVELKGYVAHQYICHLYVLSTPSPSRSKSCSRYQTRCCRWNKKLSRSDVIPKLSRTVVPRVVFVNGTIGEFIKEAGRCLDKPTGKTALTFNYGQHGNSRTADGKLLLNRNNRGASNGSTLV